MNGDDYQRAAALSEMGTKGCLFGILVFIGFIVVALVVSGITSGNILFVLLPILFVIGMGAWYSQIRERQQKEIAAALLCEMQGCMRKATQIIPTEIGETLWCDKHFAELTSSPVQCDQPGCSREATNIIPTDIADTFWCEEHFIELTSVPEPCSHRGCSQEAEITLTVRGASVHLCQAPSDEQTNRGRG